jgi:MoxR-like ATPase
MHPMHCGGMGDPTHVSEAARAFRRVVDNVERVIAGNSAAVRAAVLCLLSEGNLLLEGVPGVGKTMLARAIARSMGGTFSRIQATPDLLPSDLTGISVYDQDRRQFTFVPGPIFANVVLVDEINRTTPRTQSALLEPMEERQATIEGVAHPLPDPFLLVGTENPVEHHGTYPLPEGQLDRFTMAVRVGYPDRDQAHEVVTRQLLQHPIHDLAPVLHPDEMVRIQRAVRAVHVDTAVVDYALGLVEATRTHADVTLGASPRSAVALTRCSQALAVASGREFVLPDDLKALAPDVLGHRLLVVPQRRNGTGSGREIVEDLLEQLPVPLGVAGRA